MTIKVYFRKKHVYVFHYNGEIALVMSNVLNRKSMMKWLKKTYKEHKQSVKRIKDLTFEQEFKLKEYFNQLAQSDPESLREV